MEKIKILSDSTCDLSPELLEKYEIDLTPLTVTLGEKSGKDGIDVTPGDIYAYVEKTGVLPVTSAINTFEYREYFQKWTGQGYSVVHFCLGSGFSSTCGNACAAAKELERVYVVDSRNLSTGQGLLVMKAAELRDEGKSAEEIRRVCTELTEKVEASFVLDSLDYLYKGGRCSALAAFGGNLLKIKPCIEVQDGKMLPGRKYRGRIERVVGQYLRDRICGRDDIDPHRVFVTHTKCSPEMLGEALSIVRDEFFDADEILETTAGATVTTHCGPNTLGVLFLRK